MDEKRFFRVYHQGSMSTQEIWQDRETGVQYLWVSSGYSSGLTVLLGRDGKPLIGGSESMY